MSEVASPESYHDIPNNLSFYDFLPWWLIQFVLQLLYRFWLLWCLHVFIIIFLSPTCCNVIFFWIWPVLTSFPFCLLLFLFFSSLALWSWAPCVLISELLGEFHCAFYLSIQQDKLFDHGSTGVGGIVRVIVGPAYDGADQVIPISLRLTTGCSAVGGQASFVTRSSDSVHEDCTP